MYIQLLYGENEFEISTLKDLQIKQHKFVSHMEGNNL